MTPERIVRLAGGGEGQGVLSVDVVGTPSEAAGITIAVGFPTGSSAVLGVEYPMRMVDPSSIALIQQMRLRTEVH